MTLILGDFIEYLPSKRDSATINFTFSYNSANHQYLNNHLSFGIIAIHMLKSIGIQFSNNATGKENEIRNSVDYIANELLENSIKYGEHSFHEINIEIHVFECRVVIISTNLVNELREKLFQTYIQKIITSDVSELYFKQLEENIDNNQKSGLGLLTIINDYKAKVGWKFESSDHGYGTLSSVMVQLPAS
ncbi:MAG: DUF6272 family protein [Cyanobacteria bacterium P01_A01_bin.123]